MVRRFVDILLRKEERGGKMLVNESSIYRQRDFRFLEQGKGFFIGNKVLELGL